jgi:hypothetical protein
MAKKPARGWKPEEPYNELPDLPPAPRKRGLLLGQGRGHVHDYFEEEGDRSMGSGRCSLQVLPKTPNFPLISIRRTLQRPDPIGSHAA